MKRDLRLTAEPEVQQAQWEVGVHGLLEVPIRWLTHQLPVGLIVLTTPMPPILNAISGEFVLSEMFLLVVPAAGLQVILFVLL